MDKLAIASCMLLAVLASYSHADHVGVKITNRPAVSLVVGRIQSTVGTVDPVLDTVKEVSFTPTATDVINQISVTSADVILVEIGFRKATSDTSMTVSLTYSADSDLTNGTDTIPMSTISWQQLATGKNHVDILNQLPNGNTAISTVADTLLAKYTSTVNPAVWLGGELTFTYNPAAIYPEGTYQGKLVFKATAQVP